MLDNNFVKNLIFLKGNKSIAEYSEELKISKNTLIDYMYRGKKPGLDKMLIIYEYFKSANIVSSLDDIFFKDLEKSSMQSQELR